MDRNDLRIATPCTLDWTKMTPAEGGRFCGDCKKVVRNLSSMTEREARALLRTAGDGDLCVRYVYDVQGRIFFGKDAPKKDTLLAPSLLVRARRVAAAAAIGALPFATQGCEAVTAPLGLSQSEQQAEPPIPPGGGESMGGAPAQSYPEPPISEEDGGAPDAASDASDTDASDPDAPSAGPPRIY